MEKQQDNQVKSDFSHEAGWERAVIEKLVLATVTEQTRARRWGIFFKSLLFIYLIGMVIVAMYPKIRQSLGVQSANHTAIIKMVGIIAEDKEANAENIIESLRTAVKDKYTKGIILHANSPGGSPVQASYVYEEIRKTKKEHPDLPIYSVVSDMCASGCYYIASASDKIFVNHSSLIGSIGVIMDGFGFVESMQKLGIERRLITAGDHKALLDPFSPPKESEIRYMQGLLNQVHQQFIKAVRTGRGDRLKETSELFSGLVWSGEEGIKLGVADGFGNDDYVAKEIIGAESLVDFTREEQLLDRIAGKLGSAFGQSIGSIVQRFSLR
ncbi:Protease IV [Candidatus Methylobacter favarea]|uniref:Protease IV n=1 Tax=Candidatus Methylobacter favarea TaxID=2707345 RepID=A0A8S0XHA8_9GAMM|nr:S49 family peptidase [Candidatus Methylobacter favarea]CAA9891671.1 Protease IV [Candidatus Methylobacter favarea]